LVAAMIIGLTPVFVLGIKMVAPDRLAAIASRWSGALTPPATDTWQSADRTRPSSTPPPAIEPQPAATELMVAKAAEPPPAEPPPTDPLNGANASADTPMPEALAPEAPVPDRAASMAADKREQAAAYAFADQPLPSLKLAAETPCRCDHPAS